MRLIVALGILGLTVISSCEKKSSDDNTSEMAPLGTSENAQNIEKAVIDRFSAAAGNLMLRTPANGLPAENAPINFDQAPFITTGLGPDGRSVQYYNFDVQSLTPAPIYVLFYEGAADPVPNQMNIIDSIPGAAGYNDFWRVIKVTVPANYVANTAKSLEELQKANYSQTPTDIIVNCPVVPEGSVASKRLNGESPDLHKGWYRGKSVVYFNFGEANLRATSTGEIPTPPIYVTFNINPTDAGGGPASGFRTESGNQQTHNVIATLPGQAAYSPLWSVAVYDNNFFSTVSDLGTLAQATLLNPHVADVNCPVVQINGQ